MVWNLTHSISEVFLYPATGQDNPRWRIYHEALRVYWWDQAWAPWLWGGVQGQQLKELSCVLFYLTDCKHTLPAEPFFKDAVTKHIKILLHFDTYRHKWKTGTYKPVKIRLEDWWFLISALEEGSAPVSHEVEPMRLNWQFLTHSYFFFTASNKIMQLYQ